MTLRTATWTIFVCCYVDGCPCFVAIGCVSMAVRSCGMKDEIRKTRSRGFVPVYWRLES